MDTDDLEAIEKENNAYWLALGSFVQTYSAAEAMMQTLLWDAAGVDSKVARAVFSGVRIKEAMSQVKRIFEAHGDTSHHALEPAFRQLGTITTARNDILHYGAKFVDGRPTYVTNKRMALTPERTQHFPVSATILGQMVADLAVIMTQIEMFRTQISAPDSRFAEALARSFPDPWQYKHAPLTGNPDRTPDTAQEQ